MGVEGGSCKILLPRSCIQSSATSLTVGHYLDGQEWPQESSGRDNNRSGPHVMLVKEDIIIFTKSMVLHQQLNRDRHQLGNGWTRPLVSERVFWVSLRVEKSREEKEKNKDRNCPGKRWLSPNKVVIWTQTDQEIRLNPLNILDTYCNCGEYVGFFKHRT